MRTLPAAELLQIWEMVTDRHPIDRGLALLSAACPGWDVPRLAQLPVGRRDAMLLTLRQQLFGPRLRGQGSCPKCATEVEFTVVISQLLLSVGGERAIPEIAALEFEHALVTDKHSFRFRLPNSFDLAVIIDCASPGEARERLLRRCVTQVIRRDDNTEVAVCGLPDEELAELSKKMGELDCLADIVLDSVCPQCDHHWPMRLDVLSFFWQEIVATAKRLLYETHLLARAYAWSEAEILAMSDWRRQYYLNLVI